MTGKKKHKGGSENKDEKVPCRKQRFVPPEAGKRLPRPEDAPGQLTFLHGVRQIY